MRNQTAMTKNITQFIQAVDDLINRPIGTPGMGVLWGLPGEGKTTAVAYVANLYNAVYVRAIGCWTVTAMLGDICRCLGGERKLRRADMVQWICEQLLENPRPVFIDEADYLFRQEEMIDALRDIYDQSGSPIILIGMEDMGRKAQGNERLLRRITQWVEFTGIDISDARIVADTCCDVQVSDDLLTYLHSEARGNIGRIIIGISRIERMAKANGLDIVNRDQWGDRPLYYDQPTFGRKRNGNGTH